MAAEPVKLPLELGTLKTRDGRVFDGTRVVEQDAVGIKILHEAGSARIAYERLPDDVASRFSYDGGAAKAQLQKEAAEAAAHERAMRIVEAEAEKPADVATARRTDPRDFPEVPVETMPALDGKATSDRITALKNYIRRLEASIEEISQEIQKREERSSRLQQHPAGPDGRNSRADYVHKAMDKRLGKMKQAGQQIRDAERQIEVLERAQTDHLPSGTE